ncbi:cytochrome P450 [Oscillatoriales cyanobacterium LEGE 11467]|uniref:Cytochrome P450 n=2 Tax=Zarconia TaxID=2992130 RepID=A0A928W0Y5_9CYAN|nr:cytochrome P450 [Zarconia navalis LEGE 11467]
MSAKQPQGVQSFSWRQKIQWVRQPMDLLETLTGQYGDTFSMPGGSKRASMIFTSDPQGIREIFATDSNCLDSGRAAGVQLPLLGPNSLIALDGERHKRQRKLLMPPFHGERMRSYGELIREITHQVTGEWAIDSPFSMREAMQAISFRVILKAVFGIADGPRYDRLKAVLMARLNPRRPLVTTLMLMFPVLQKDWGRWSPWGRMMEQQRQIDELLYAEISDRRANFDPSRTDILSLMMAAQDENGEAMSDEELRDELITLLVAGHETTATALAWALYWVHHQPEVGEKLRRELDGLAEKTDPNEILKLPYLNAVVQETLRMYPVVMFALPRLVKAPVQILGYDLEPGSVISPCIYLTHHRSDLYPEPKEFRPERFLEKQFLQSEYLPFGGGNRRCIGLAFALFEMKLVLATVLSNWEMELASSQPIKPVRRGLLIAPENGVPMVVKGKRTQPQPVLERS